MICLKQFFFLLKLDIVFVHYEKLLSLPCNVDHNKSIDGVSGHIHNSSFPPCCNIDKIYLADPSSSTLNWMNEKRIRIRKLTQKNKTVTIFVQKWRHLKHTNELCFNLDFSLFVFHACVARTRVDSNWSLGVKSAFFLCEKIMSWLKGSKNKIDRYVEFNCQRLHNRKLNYEAKMRVIRVGIEFYRWPTQRWLILLCDTNTSSSWICMWWLVRTYAGKKVSRWTNSSIWYWHFSSFVGCI